MSIRSTVLISGTLFLMAILVDCGRKEAGGEDRDPKSILSEGDLTIAGLTPQVDSTTIVRAIGRPDSIRAIEPSEGFPHFGFSIWHYRDYQLVFNPVGILDAIKVLHRGIKTPRGLCVGDSLTRVRELYGRSLDDFDIPYASLSYRLSGNDTTGIIVRIDSNAVTYIYIGRFF